MQWIKTSWFWTAFVLKMMCELPFWLNDIMKTLNIFLQSLVIFRQERERGRRERNDFCYKQWRLWIFVSSYVSPIIAQTDVILLTHGAQTPHWHRPEAVEKLHGTQLSVGSLKIYCSPRAVSVFLCLWARSANWDSAIWHGEKAFRLALDKLACSRWNRSLVFVWTLLKLIEQEMSVVLAWCALFTKKDKMLCSLHDNFDYHEAYNSIMRKNILIQ